MSSLNKTQLIGRVGKTPEVRNLDSGKVVANFTLATSETYKDKTTGEKKTNTEWHNISLFGGIAEIAQKYVNKGDLIFIEGKLKTRSWEKDGVTRYTTEIVGDNLILLGSKGSSSESRETSNPQDNSTDDFPF